VQRAEASGCQAIVVTLDTTMLGWRSADLNLGWLPFLRGMGIAQYTSDPVFQRLLSQNAFPEDNPPPRTVNASSIGVLLAQLRRHPGSWWANLRSGEATRAVQLFTRIYSRPSLEWSDLRFLRDRTRLPILLKGIQHPEDARKSLDHGVDGLVVSNHGGRQVDGALAALDALPGVLEAVQGRIPVLLDSGIRSGADAFKALALGADAVGIGRPYVYALALAGQAGVEALFGNFQAEFDLTLGLSGCTQRAEIGAAMLGG
jgi:lactate 2-monooxygenase